MEETIRAKQKSRIVLSIAKYHARMFNVTTNIQSICLFNTLKTTLRLRIDLKISKQYVLVILWDLWIVTNSFMCIRT